MSIHLPFIYKAIFTAFLPKEYFSFTSATYTLGAGKGKHKKGDRKMKRIIGLVFSLTMAALLIAGCSSKSAAQSSKLTIVGSTALQPLIEQAAKQYQESNSGASITVQGGGSGTGLSQIQNGSVSIGNSDVFASQVSGINTKKIVDHKVAVVGITPVVNPDTGVTNLSMQQLQDIFTGKVRNWQEVGGKDRAITVINRAKGSGTRITFEQSVMNGQTAIKSQEQDSNGTVQKLVSTTSGSISYVAFSYVTAKLQAVSIDNVKPTDANVKTNQWKIWAYEHMYTTKKADVSTKKFIKYVESAKVQKTLVKKLGYISIQDMKVTKDAANQVK